MYQVGVAGCPPVAGNPGSKPAGRIPWCLSYMETRHSTQGKQKIGISTFSSETSRDRKLVVSPLAMAVGASSFLNG